MGRLRPLLFLIPACVVLLAACQARPGDATPAAVEATAMPAIVVVAQATATPAATLTPAPSATATATPTATASPVPTETPTATPTLHPMMIAAMRQLEYPGSDISLVATLEPGSNYHRYRASYLSEGLTQYALLTVPFGEPPASGWPAIVFNHGFIPPDQYRTTERYIAYVDNLARSGYVVFRIDYRGHDESQGEARGAYGYPDYTIDVLNAYASLERYPAVDPERIGMWGHSMGGYLTLRAMVINPDIKAGVIWAGVVASYADLLDRWRGPFVTPTPDPLATPDGRGRGWRGRLVEEFGLPSENPAFWDAISSNSYLADLSGPVQLHHGTADTSVPLVFSTTLRDQVLAVGGAVEYYEYDGDNHNLAGFFTTAMTRTIVFFDRYLKGS
jgi:dipeptidyl aminopeptidase/acylaminoacyl peptidase